MAAKPLPKINQESQRIIRDLLLNKASEYSKMARLEPVERFQRDYETICSDIAKIMNFIETSYKEQ